jgi:two-component system phosphate regulon response regulator PhoB
VETGSREENASKQEIAFSSEVETGSREENASKQEIAFSSEVETGSREENASKQERRLEHMSARILVVEDEEALTTLLRYNLDAEGYDVETVGRGDDADTRLKERVPDLIVLDWMLPGLSGIELCRRLRARPETKQLPIIMLTARGEESERVRGLATGADDYIVKPFSVPELLARVKGLLRRASPERLATVLSYGDIELDREKRRVARSGRPIDLGPTEYRLLEFFLEHPGRVFSREQLLDSVWGRDIYIDERTVDVHIGRLRKLLNPGREQDPIRTVRGAGYALDDRFAKAAE